MLKPDSPLIARWLLLSGAALLAAQPLLWLANTWVQPAYDSDGLWIALLVIALFLWSWTSPIVHAEQHQRWRDYAPWLLLAAAALRLAGQLLGVNTLSALTLTIDVYALALLVGLGQRQRGIAPGWLALLFAFSLPLERIVQRSVGFLLQQFSADGACTLLSIGGADIRCEGLRIVWAGHDVLVDLPCSGASSLTLLLAMMTTLCVVLRPTLTVAATGFALTLVSAWLANCVRIVLLAAGLVYGDTLYIDVMAAPWHELIGLFTLALGALPLLAWARKVRPTQSAIPAKSSSAGRFGVPLAAGFFVAAAVIISLPARPVDVAKPMPPIALPSNIDGLRAVTGQLNDQEQAYFTRFGGAAARAGYGPYGLLLVQTSAPLRHLHAPDECLTGSGYRVRYLGPSYGRLPSAIYRAEDAQGRAWRVAVSFVSDRGELSTSVTEAVWRWLRAEEHSTWTMVQRIAPWDLSPAELEAWDAAVARALDLPAFNNAFI